MIRVIASALLAGVLFGIGVAISGMTNRFVILGFLDLFGEFNPQLLFVLGGAVGVTALSFRLVLRRSAPMFGTAFQLPTRNDLDMPLLLGAGIFGVGWGLVGFCPGPALAGLGAVLQDALIFVPAMLLGSAAHWLSLRSGKR